jgi:hypothetical protein
VIRQSVSWGLVLWSVTISLKRRLGQQELSAVLISEGGGAMPARVDIASEAVFILWVKIFRSHMRYVGRMLGGVFDTNNKTNYRTRQKTARRI